MDTKQAMGVVGAVLIFLGVFAPVDSLPLLGPVSYVGKWNMAGTLALVLAAATLLLVALGKCRLLWGTGIASLLLFAITFVMLLSLVEYEMQAGWVLLFAGGAVVTATAAYEEWTLRS